VQTTSTPGPQTLADRYIALWSEPDEQARRAAIRALWAPGGAHVLQPPAEVVKIAASWGFDSPSLEARGYVAIETRVRRSFDRFVAAGEFTFRAKGGAVRLGQVVLRLDDDGAISRDTMFPG